MAKMPKDNHSDGRLHRAVGTLWDVLLKEWEPQAARLTAAERLSVVNEVLWTYELRCRKELIKAERKGKWKAAGGSKKR